LSLIVLLILCVALRSRVRFFSATAALAAAALFGTPILWQMDFSASLHPFLANYLNGRANPLFPMFPWAVFCWAGALAGGSFLHAASQGREARANAVLLGTGVAAFVAGFLMRHSQWFPYTNFWLDSPQWMLMRLGMVLALFALFWRMEARGIGGAKMILALGMESLVAYVVHLVGIYWITGEKAGLPLLGYRAYGIPATLLLYACLLGFTALVVRLWTKFRSRKRASA
jgi:uncharacterized membrane protein (GlpM family)